MGDIRAQALIPPTEERKLTTEYVRHDLAQNSGTAAEPDRVRVIREGVASYLPDIDPTRPPNGWSRSTRCWSGRGRRGRGI